MRTKTLTPSSQLRVRVKWQCRCRRERPMLVFGVFSLWRAHIGRGPCQGDCVLGVAHYQLSGYVTFPIPEKGPSPHNSARAASVISSSCGRARVVDNRPTAMPVVGWLHAGRPTTADRLAAFRQGLNNLGYI